MTTNTTTERIQPALTLWGHIFEGERGLLHIWTGTRDDENLIKPKLFNFNYPAAAEAAARWALEKSDGGCEVYFCAHLLTAPQRIKENAAQARAAWFEMDEGELPNGQLRPTAVVESSPGRYHGYLRLTDAIPPQAVEQLNQRLAHAIGADPSGADLSQILRVPGTRNHKYDERPEVRLIGIRADYEYTPRLLDELLPDDDERDRDRENDADSGPLDDEPPIDLDPEALKVWRGEAPKLKEGTGEVDKSATLMKIGRVLFDAGANERVVVEALAERDRSLGYNKYSGNRDGGQREYERIFAKLQEEGRNPRMRRGHSGGGAKSPPGDSDDSNDSNDSDFQDLADLPDPEEFPLTALPLTVRQFVREATASVGCPVDYIGLSTLAALSAAIGDTRRIVLKKDWTEGAAIFGMIVGGPASKKTPAMNLALRPVRERQMALQTEYERQKEEYEIALVRHKEALKDNPDARKPDKPTLGRTWADDATVERLAGILNENCRGVVLIKDELSGWLGAMNQYKQGGKGADRQFWLSVHTNQPVTVDRKSSDEPVIVPHPWASVIGGIQPEVLPDFGKDRGDGLIDRFIPVYPEPRVGRWSDAEISDHVREEYAKTIGSLYRLRHANDDEDPFPSRVGMTEEAKALFVAAYNRLHDELETPGFPQRLRPAWGKLEAYLARLALIVAMTRIAERGNQGQIGIAEIVTREDMSGAVKLLTYFKNHVRRVYTGLYGDNPADRLAADLRDFLLSVGGSWEGIASELHKALVSEHKPERPEDLAKAVRGIAKRSPVLHLEDLQRTKDRRPFRLTLKNAVIADTAVTADTSEGVA